MKSKLVETIRIMCENNESFAEPEGCERFKQFLLDQGVSQAEISNKSFSVIVWDYWKVELVALWDNIYTDYLYNKIFKKYIEKNY